MSNFFDKYEKYFTILQQALKGVKAWSGPLEFNILELITTSLVKETGRERYSLNISTAIAYWKIFQFKGKNKEEICWRGRML